MSRPRPIIRFAYVIGQAVIPVFLSFALILSPRALYATYRHSAAAIGLRPVNDQQVAGFVSKLSMLFVLLIVGAVILNRTPSTDDDFGPEDPLLWADVERQFERVDRQRSTEDRTSFESSHGPLDLVGPDDRTDQEERDQRTGPHDPDLDPDMGNDVGEAAGHDDDDGYDDGKEPPS